jgi:hypothetical protein
VTVGEETYDRRAPSVRERREKGAAGCYSGWSAGPLPRAGPVKLVSFFFVSFLFPIFLICSLVCLRHFYLVFWFNFYFVKLL